MCFHRHQLGLLQPGRMVLRMHMPRRRLLKANTYIYVCIYAEIVRILIHVKLLESVLKARGVWRGPVESVWKFYAL
jgi:hypothetical protein